MLVPLPLATRVAAAPLIVEAQVDSQQVVAHEGRLFTVSNLTVFQVFRGTVPASGLRLAEPGGTLGPRAEVVSTAVGLLPGEQGLFLLEPDPAQPGTGRYRLAAGPQGLLRYDLAARAAAGPFTRYPSIEADLYPAVEAATGQARRGIQPNPALTAPRVLGKVAATPVISSFSPAALVAGKRQVLTINGSNFGAVRGSGSVAFRNADDGGSTFINANDTDYQSWSDTQIQVVVASDFITVAGTAGTGIVRVTNGSGETSFSATALTVTYALSNVTPSGGDTPGRVRLINDDGQGGYTLRYSPGFAGNTAAVAAHERALLSWRCATPLRRATSTTTTTDVATRDNINVVRYAPPSELGMGVLGVTVSYYSGCSVNGVAAFSLVETDYSYNNTTNWNYATTSPSGSQFDFESVALHELGHGTQLSHIIDASAVMHFSISNGQAKRTLEPATDVAGGNDVFSFSATNPCPTFAPPTAGPGCAPLPVALLAFTARAEAGAVALRWATARETNSARFEIERGTDGRAFIRIGQVAARGTTATPTAYTYADESALTAANPARTLYYRLRQVDLGGAAHYAPVAAVRPATASGLALYPNPAADYLRLSGIEGPGCLTLFDAAGHHAATFHLPAGVGQVSVAGLPPGVYLAEWQAGGAVQRARLLKQ